MGGHCDTHPVDQHRQWRPLKLPSDSLQRVQVKWDSCSVSQMLFQRQPQESSGGGPDAVGMRVLTKSEQSAPTVWHEPGKNKCRRLTRGSA